MNQYKNLVEMLMDRRVWSGGMTFIDSPERKYFMSYGGIYQKAASILFGLQKRGLKPGDELIFQINDNRDFIGVFWACLMGKIIPVPVTEGTNDESRLKMFGIWKILNNPYLVTFKEHLERLGAYAAASGKHKLFNQMRDRAILIEDVNQIGGAAGKIFTPDASDIAYIQFSSGSTGDPKGVVLTHKNLLTNLRANIKGLGEPERGIDRYFSWMPLTHDMGLIGFHLTPMAAGWEHTLMAPRVFIRSPHYWLTEMADLKSTITVSPNFGYQYVLKHFDPAKNPGLDLSVVRIIVNGAEPISPTVCAEFSRTLAPFGLRKNAIFPAYGMAEASLSVTLAGPGEDVVVVHLDRNSLHRGERVRPADSDSGAVSLVEVGTPVQDCSIKIVDEKGDVCQDEVIGEILIKGDNVTSGYYNNSRATAEAISADGWLRTGDLGFLRRGRLVITGRAKEIIFSRGQNYYPHDIERAAEELAGIEFEKIAVSGVYSADRQSDKVICFVVFKRKPIDFLPLAAALREHIAEKIGIDVHNVIPVKKIPKTTSGKIQRYKLRAEYLEGKYDSVMQEIAALENEIKEGRKSLPGGELEKIIAEIWQEVLHLDGVMGDDNFFDLGGNSSQAMQVKARLQIVLGTEIDDVTMFKYPTIKTLSEYFGTGTAGAESWIRQREHLKSYCRDRGRVREKITGGGGLEIAVIGMAGRFPGARNIGEFWNNLKAGMESISFFSDEELSEGGLDRQLLENPDYVKARGLLEELDYFDDSFFGYTPLEAEQLDPQMRIFFECAWEALEDAGYDPFKYSGLIGVYAGASPNPLWETASLLSGRGSASEQFTDTQLNDKDFMSTWLSYKLNLKGPSFIMYTACSTSLAAVDLACQGLWIGRCDMALAGGVSIWLPQKMGYLYEEGMIFSRDGHNRTFDEEASGTIFSDGIGLVLLKRLAEAVDDGDHIYAVIKGSGVNNDGDRKVGYTAPALDGQAEVIAAALQMADAAPESIGYVEAHGTATVLGDPIEIEALKMAFPTDRRGCCAVGSVKSNIGHLNAAAGIAGFIKAVLAIRHRLIPPSPHFEKANRRIDFGDSPFYVNTRLQEWKNDKYPLRAGVSSFGIGGTNAHVILEEPPRRTPCLEAREWKILVLSAKTKDSLQGAAGNLAKFLENNPGINISDAAFTLQVGRKHFGCRKMLVCADRDEAVEILSSPGSGRAFTFDPGEKKAAVIFMFPGQGAQYVNMGLGLYRHEKVFRQHMDRCFDIFKSQFGCDLKAILYPGQAAAETAAKLKQTEIIQPLMFIFEYALAKLLMSWGIHPEVMIGYSFGEYTAACLAGVFSPEDALRLVGLRGRLMQQMPEGAMLSVPLTAAELKPLLNDQLSIAIDNGPSCIVTGTAGAVDAFEKLMKGKRYLCIRVGVSHISHSAALGPVLAEFEKEVRKIELKEPRVPYISNVTGKAIRQAEATDPLYWVNHLKDTVRFGAGVTELSGIPNGLFVEVGPGRDLCVLLKGHRDCKPEQKLVSLVRHEKEEAPDLYYLLNRIGHLWLYGVDIDWRGFYGDEERCRIPLPTYSFERHYFAIKDIPLRIDKERALEAPLRKKADVGDWFYIPVWKRARISRHVEVFTGSGPMKLLLFMDDGGLGDKIAVRLRQQGARVVLVYTGKTFSRLAADKYAVNPVETGDYEALLKELTGPGSFGLPCTVLHLWNVGPVNGQPSGVEWAWEAQDKGFFSLIALAQVLGKQDPSRRFQVKVAANNVLDVVGGEVMCPEKATLLGPVKVIPQEYGNIDCCLIDIELPKSGTAGEQELVERLVEEVRIKIQDPVIGYRNNHRWLETFEPVEMEKAVESVNTAAGLREGGVYLVTGGVGGIGLILARYLAGRGKPKLILTGRSHFPPPAEWDHWLSTHNGEEKTSDRIRQIREIEALGAEVLVLTADVALPGEMRQVITQINRRFGKINGVIHAAGVPDGSMILRRTREMSEAVLAPKVTGTLVLDRLLKDVELDFFILCSSMASLLPMPGQTAYAAANAFLDAFAVSPLFGSSKTPISINWDRWQHIGVAVIAETQHKELWGEEMEEGITPSEGVEAFGCILSDPLPRAVVCPVDLKLAIRQYNASRGLILNGAIKGDSSDTRARTIHQRPQLSVEYVEPGDGTEQKLSEVWQNFLGIDRVGIHDNFFELGATSLGILQVNGRLKNIFKRDIPPVTLYSYPTVALLAKFLNRENGQDFFDHEPRALAARDRGQEKRKNLRSLRRSEL